MKPKEIIELEEILNIEFRLNPLSDIMDSRKDAYDSNHNFFALDSHDNVIGLNLYVFREYLNIKNVDFLNKFKHINYLQLEATSVFNTCDYSILSEFTNLLELDLGDNEIIDYSFLHHLERLTILKLRNNRITEIAFLNNLTGLTELSIADNEIENINVLSNLSRLNKLNAYKNQIKDLLPISKLKEIYYLEISANNISDIKPLGNLSKLEYLNLSFNKITDILYLQNLQKIETLRISNNKLSDLNPFRNLINTKKLDVNSNQIYDILPLQNLKNLSYLDISNNLITNIYLAFLENFPKLNELYLHGNPIENIPPEIFDKGYKNVLPEVLAYLRSLEEDEAIPNDEVKLVWLGNTTAGKSSIFKYLQERKYVQGGGSTHGIKNVLWSPAGKDFNVNVWDFGGQEFYHATHRLFLSQNAVNVVVFEKQTNQNGTLQTEIYLYENNESVKKEMHLEHFHFTYWLDSLQHWAGKTDALLVQNKLDCGKTVSITDEEKKTYQIAEDNIFRISVEGANAQYETHILQFRLFEKRLLGMLEHIKATYPFSKKQMEIKHRLRALGETQSFFETYEDYVAFCEEIRPKISEVRDGTSMLNVFTNYAQQIGVLLHFPQASEKVFINPAWLIDVFYRILDYGVLRNKGEFSEDERLAYICEEKGIEPKEAIALMKQFELIFETEKKGNTLFVAPQYLPTLEEKSKKNEDFSDSMEIHKAQTTFVFSLQYPKFMPKSNFLRFLAKYGAESKPTFFYWKNGLVFFSAGKTIFAECRQEEKQIVLQIQDADKSLAYSLFKALYEIDSNESIEVSVPQTGFVNFVKLKERYERGRQEIEDFDIKHFAFLFGKTQQETVIPSEPTPKIKILMLTANPAGTNQLNLDKEKSIIHEAVQHNQNIDDMMFNNTDYNAFLNHIIEHKPDILHFSGHADRNGLMLQNDIHNGSETIPAENLVNTFEYFAKEGLYFKVIILNACYTQTHAELLEKYADFVICTSRAIQDTYAIDFSKGFYSRLSRNLEEVKQAFEAGVTMALQKGAEREDFILIPNL